MTVKYKPLYAGGHGARHRMEPRRHMIAADLGLALLKGPYDPDLLAIGIQAPRLTNKQLNINRLKALASMPKHMTEAQREEIRDRSHFWRTTEGKAVKQKVRHILNKIRRAGEVQK